MFDILSAKTMATLATPSSLPIVRDRSGHPASDALLGLYKRAPMELVRGDGVRLFDADGKSYLDFGSGIAVNALWPRTLIATAALLMLGTGVTPAMGRKPEIVADAAHAILCRDSRSCSGNFFIDDEVLAAEGVTDLSGYSTVAGQSEFLPDLFLDPL